MLIRRRGVESRTFFGAVIPSLALSSVVGILVFIGFSSAQLGFDSEFRSVIAAGAAVLPVMTLAWALSGFANAHEMIMLTTASRTVTAVVPAIAVVIVVLITPLTLFTAVVAQGLGALAAVGILSRGMRVTRVFSMPRWNSGLIGEALRIGLPIEASRFVVTVAARADILMVLAIAGPSEAGYYSVALTVGQLAGFPALAMTAAAFPRLSSASDDEATLLTERVVRVSTAACFVLSIAIAAALPFLTGTIFGQGFAPAIVPALISIVGGLLAGQQFVLGRSWAARGKPRLLLYSFGLTAIVMVLADLLLVPRWESVGASAGAVVANAAGVSVCLAFYRKELGPSFGFGRYVPHRSDFQLLLHFVTRRHP